MNAVMYLPFFECTRIFYMVHTNQLCYDVKKVFRTAITKFYQKIISGHLTLSTYTPTTQEKLRFTTINTKRPQKLTLVLYVNHMEEERVTT